MSDSAKERLERVHELERGQRRQQWVRAAAFGLLILVVIVGIGYFLSPLFSPKASGVMQTENGKVINVQAAMDGFDLTEIHVKAGETVTVNLRSLDNSMHTDGGGKHQFAIDELGVDLVAQPMSTNSASFTASRPGEYTFYCDICCGGKANPTMNGKFIIEA